MTAPSAPTPPDGGRVTPCFGEHGQCQRTGVVAIVRTLSRRFIAVAADFPSALASLTYCADHAVVEFDDQIRSMQKEPSR